MKTLTIQQFNGKSYQVIDGTSYHRSTSPEVIKVLEKFRHNRQTITVKLGDTITGRDWMEENDTTGIIGRSTGTIKIPLLIPDGECGGPGLMEHCIVKIVVDGKTLYQHPKYNRPDVSVQPSDMPEYVASGYVGGILHARFKTANEASQWLATMLA